MTMETLVRDVPSSVHNHNNSSVSNMKHSYVQLSKTCLDEDAQINKKLPKELLLRIFSYLDVVSLCRCAQVSRAWNVLALDGSNWQKIDLFEFQTDVEGPVIENISRRCGGFLRQISLRGCQSVGDGSLKTLAQFCNYIEYINLNGCKRITDSTSQSLSQYCKKLLSLDIGSCSMVTDLSLKAISDGCPNLTSVNISWCDGITENGVEALAHGCPKLKSFISKGCTRMTTRAISCLAQHCIKLEVINLHGCNNIEDEAVIKLANNCNFLKYLCLANCSLLTDNCLVSLAEQCYQLNTLEVAGCSQFTDIGFLALSKTCHLMEKMDLEECVFITDSTLFHLAMGCPRLENLSLSHCELITDEGIRHLSTSTCASEHLAVLELDNCPLITDASLEHLINCHNLQRIMLYDCQLITRNGIKRLRFWKTISDEHGLDEQGQFVGYSADEQLDRINVYYDETQGKVYVPRAVLVDSDSTLLNTIGGRRCGGNAYRKENFVGGNGGTGSNWAKGYYSGDRMASRVADAVRSEAERCDRLQGFQLVHSLGGGTGSGLGTRVLENIRTAYPGRAAHTYSVVPWTAVSDEPADTYNVMLSVAGLVGGAQATYLADNRELYRACCGHDDAEAAHSGLNKDHCAAAYADLNHLVSQTMSGVTTGLRFAAGRLNSDMKKCTANLVPYPRLHFFAPAFVPLALRGQTDARAHRTVPELASALFESVCQQRRRCADAGTGAAVLMAVALTFRGRHLVATAGREGGEPLQPTATGWTVHCSDVKAASYGVPSRGLENSGTAVANTTAVRHVLTRDRRRFASMLTRRKLLHLYAQEGMADDQFRDALDRVESLSAEYRAIERADDDGHPSDDDDGGGHRREASASGLQHVHSTSAVDKLKPPRL